MTTIGDFKKSSAKEVEVLKNDIALFKNLILERKHSLDLVRELVSNAGAKEVGATRIDISYTVDKEGHIFEVSDNGCGMNFTGMSDSPGRLDKFLGLGMSAIVGQESDEFSWKGLGSKLAYQSKRVEIKTRFAGQPYYSVEINDPWGSLERNVLPKPKITEFVDPDEKPFTRVKVIGHPPHKQDKPFSFEEIRAFLLHRTFAGFTRERTSFPNIFLSVLGKNEELIFGFPEFINIVWPDGVHLDISNNVLKVNLFETGAGIGPVRLKGLLTWDASKYNLHQDNLNTGLILSSKGIPYFSLNLKEYGARSIPTARPGIEKTCLVVECDGIHSRMNISRSGMVDSAETDTFAKAVSKLFEKLEKSPEYLGFRQMPTKEKEVASADHIASQKKKIEAEEQNWVVYQSQSEKPLVLMREPRNEAEVNGLIWKLEALKALPFKRFQSLAYIGAKKGPDLLVNFQEDDNSEPNRSTIFEIENNFYSYKSHGHRPSQYPKIICWDAPTSGRKDRFEKTAKKFKFTIQLEEYQVHIFILKLMGGISVMSRRELKTIGEDF